jgi:hypothetical protein
MAESPPSFLHAHTLHPKQPDASTARAFGVAPPARKLVSTPCLGKGSAAPALTLPDASDDPLHLIHAISKVGFTSTYTDVL